MIHNSVVLVKQVPDTANISGQVMRSDGTVNRGKLPAIFNPEDKVALELALQLRDRFSGKVSVVTMGPPKASDLLRECLYMGADTLATSYVLSEVIKKIGDYDLIFAGRQAIDGDTAQVGPQTAEKLGIPQITYAEEILDLQDNRLVAKRRIDGGHEILESTMPVLITVIKDAAIPRPFKAKRVMAFKNARTLLELEKMAESNSLLYVEDLKQEYESKDLYIPTYTIDDLDVDPSRCGLAGSPTKVHKVEYVVLGGSEHEKIEPTRAGLDLLVDQLMQDHIFG